MNKKLNMQGKFMLMEILLGAILLGYFLTMYSMDNPVIFEAAYYRLDCLFKGNIMDFLFDWSPIVPYNVLSQMVFTIWVFPIKILNLLLNISLESSIGAYLWYKLLIVLCSMLIMIECKKIAVTLGIDEINRRWIVFFTASSLFFVLPIFHLAQVDAIYIPFMLYGVRKYIEGDYKKFLIAFAIANPVKYLPIFIYIPLILLKEKRIPYILRDILLGLILVPIDIIVKNMTSILYWMGFISDESVKIPYVLANSQIRALLFNSFAGPDGISAAVVVVAYGAICILAYCCYYESEQRGEMTIWLSFSSLALLFTFGTMHCQWIILLVPFMLLLVFENKTRINYILETLMTMGFVGSYVITQSEIYGGRSTFDSLLFSLSDYLMQRRSSHANNDMIHFIMDTYEYPGEYERIMPAIAVVTMISFIIINCPFVRTVVDKCKKREIEMKETTIVYWGWFRIVILVMWFLVNFYCLFK